MANYTVITYPVTINANQSWGQQDIPDDLGETISNIGIVGTGDPDGGENPLYLLLVADDGYIITPSNFTIKGYQPSYESGDIREWQEGQTTTDISGESVTISIGESVTKVRMQDTGDTGNILVTAWVDSNYSIGTQNIEIILDIDGDAALIENTSASNQFELWLSVPAGSNMHVLPNIIDASPNSVGSVEVTASGSNVGRILVTMPEGYNEYTTLGSTYGFWSTYFFICPDNGYTLSRHNLRVQLIESTISEDSVEWNGQLWDTYSNVNNQPNTVFEESSNPYPLGDIEDVNYGLTQLGNFGSNFVDLFNNNMLQGGSQYAITCYKNPMVFLGNTAPLDVVEWYDLNSENNYLSSTGCNICSNTNVSSEDGDVILIDTASAWNPSASNYENPGYPFHQPNYNFIDGNLPSNYCSSDYANNCVAVNLRSFWAYQPGLNPVDIGFVVLGEAMLNDNLNCVPCEININC